MSDIDNEFDYDMAMPKQVAQQQSAPPKKQYNNNQAPPSFVMAGLVRMNQALGNPFPQGQEKELQKFLIIKGSRGETFIWNESCESYSFWDSRDDLHPALRDFCPNCYSPSHTLSNMEIREKFVFRATTIRFHMLGIYSRIDPATKTASISCLRPTKHQPAYHQDVNEWFEAIAGPMKDKFLDWVASFPQLNRPTCALYLYGKKGIGKNLLAEGLSEVFGLHGKWKEVSGDFQSSMGLSPVLWANEKMEKPKNSQTIDVLRDLIGTGSNYINEKNRPGYDMEGFYRLIITANNDGLLKKLGSHNKDDLEATRERVGFLEVDEGAVGALDRIARKNGTDLHSLCLSFKTHKIAEHALWLAKNRQLPNFRSQRFLVEGWASACSDNLDNESLSARDLAVLFAYIYGKPHVNSLKINNGFALINVKSAVNDWDAFGPRSERAPNWKYLTEYLPNISDSKESKIRLRPTSDRKSNPINYWKVPLEKLLLIMEANGFETDNLGIDVSNLPFDAINELMAEEIELANQHSGLPTVQEPSEDISETVQEILSAINLPEKLEISKQVELSDKFFQVLSANRTEALKLIGVITSKERIASVQSTLCINIMSKYKATLTDEDRQNEVDGLIEEYVFRYKSNDY